MGYVAVSIAYRLNYNLFSTYSAERAIYRGLQDLSAAVRYLREHHTDYGIDYNNIYIWGSSAGAFSGIHLSFMEEDDRMASTFVNNFGWDPDLGCIDCSGNDFDHDRKPKAVIACWGGIFDLDWINEGDEIPVIMFHGVADSTVQFNEGYPFQNQFSLPWLYGSNLVYNKLDSLNIQSELHAPEGMDHEYWGTYAGDWTGDGPNENFAIIKEEAYSFLFDVLYPFQMGIVNAAPDIIVEEDSDQISMSLLGSVDSPYFFDTDGNVLNFAAHTSGSDLVSVLVDGDSMHVSLTENAFGNDSIFVIATDISGESISDTILVVVNSVNDVPSAFSLVSPEDSAEVIITAASVAQDATIEIAWSPSTDADGDSLGYGFVLFAGEYSVSTPALYTADVLITALAIPHEAAAGLLETAGYQSITCDWMVFATDGQDTMASAEIRTITIDARPVLSTGELAIPEVFALHQNYPNPFNPTTTIKYDLPEAQNVQVMIYDIMGRKIKSLISFNQEAGYKSIIWNATNELGQPVSAGMYIYTIQAGEFRQTRKMVLLK